MVEICKVCIPINKMIDNIFMSANKEVLYSTISAKYQKKLYRKIKILNGKKFTHKIILEGIISLHKHIHNLDTNILSFTYF